MLHSPSASHKIERRDDAIVTSTRAKSPFSIFLREVEKPTLTTMEPQTYNYFVYVGLMVLGLAVLGFLTSIICTVYQSRQAKRRPHQPLRPRCEREDAKNEHEWVERREHPWLDSIRAQERPFEDDLEPTPRDVTPKKPPPEEPAPPQTVFESIQSRWRNGFWGGPKAGEVS